MMLQHWMLSWDIRTKGALVTPRHEHHSSMNEKDNCFLLKYAMETSLDFLECAFTPSFEHYNVREYTLVFADAECRSPY